MLEPSNNRVSISRQSDLLDISRSSFYYVPRIDEREKQIMNSIDKIYTAKPFYGSRRIRDDLEDYYETSICREHVQRLMRLMGIEAIYPKKKLNLSQNRTLHKIYPYLLKNYQITKSNQVWAYLTAILYWYSRYVVAWEISETMESDFCIRNLERALEISLPGIHNSDQGVQFTDKKYTGILEERKVQISMDGRGRCMDNIFTERLWRTVKYENVFLKSYHDTVDARAGLKDYFNFYNTERRHMSLDNRTPESVYRNSQ